MSNHAKAVLTEAFRDSEVDCTWTPEGHAAHALAALKAARISVVELPEARIWDGPGREHYWRIGDTTVSVDKHNMPSITLDDDWSDDETPPTPSEMRELAAALLSAADHMDAAAVGARITVEESMSWESDERDAALKKLERIEELCHWVERRRLPAHRMVIKDILAIIDGPDR